MARRRSGFTLPAVLAVTGVVTLIFLVAITALASLTAEARSTRERVRFMQRALTAEAQFQYVAVTEPFVSQGLEVGGVRRLLYEGQEPDPTAATVSTPVSLVHLDGRPYSLASEDPGAGTVILSLRDQAGMINLARLDDSQLERIGGMIGLDPATARSLGPRYTDYVDIDDLMTANGAERSSYGGDGPANRQFLRPAEFLSLLGVREGVEPRRWREIQDDLAVDHTNSALNLNTASAKTLEALFGISTDRAEAAVRARDNAPFLSLNDFLAVSGALTFMDENGIYVFPSGRIVYTINDTRSPWRYRARLVVTPDSNERPFWSDQTEMTEALGGAMASTNADPFPYTPR